MSKTICPVCDTSQELRRDQGKVWGPCASCRSMLFHPTGGPRVLIAHGSDNLCHYLGSVLVEAGFSPVRAADGQQVLQILERVTPAAAVLDVGLSDVMTFQLIGHMQRPEAPGETKIILLASVYRRSAYKRTPSSLYGADDYVEQHHIPDMLPTKLCRLLDIDTAAVEALIKRSQRDPLDDDGRADLWGHERVWALAHSIVSDIALYHENEFARAIEGGGPPPLIQTALDEGRQLLADMTTEADYPTADPVQDAFSMFIERLRSEAQ